MAQLLQPQHANPLHSPLGVHVNDARTTRNARRAARRLTSQSVCSSSGTMNGGRLGCGSLSTPSAPRLHAARKLGHSSSLHGTTTSRRAPGEVRRRLASQVVRASSGDGNNPLPRPLAWLVDNIFPALAPILRPEQQQQQPDLQQGQPQRSQQQTSQQQQSQQSNQPQQSEISPQDFPERQIPAEASGAQEDSAVSPVSSFGPEASEPGYVSELQGNPQQPGFWNVGTSLGIFSGNGQRSLKSVMERSNGGDAPPDSDTELTTSVATDNSQDENGDLSWERWDQYMDQVDERTLHTMEVLSALDTAISEGRYEEAALLKKEVDSLHAQNAVAVAHDDLALALEEDRFEDAAKIRDEALTNIVGWWAGRGSDDPFGHLMYVYKSNSYYVGRVIGGAQVAEYTSAAENGDLAEELLPAALQQAGLPLMEVFLRRDEQAPHQMRHCSAVLVPTASIGMDVGSGDVSLGGGVGTFRIQLGSNGQMTVDSSGMAEVGDSQQIEGVLSAIVSAISDNMSTNATSEADSSDEDEERSDSEEEEEEEEQTTSAMLEGATAEEVLDSLRADVMRQLGAATDSEGSDDETIIVGTASDGSGINQQQFKNMFADALKQVGLEQSEDGNSVVINVQTVANGGGDDSDDIMEGLTRGRADLSFFGRDRFAIQACKDPNNPDAWNNNEEDSSDDDEVPSSMTRVASREALRLKHQPESELIPRMREMRRLLRNYRAQSSSDSSTAAPRFIKIADFEDSDDSASPSTPDPRRPKKPASSSEDSAERPTPNESRSKARDTADDDSTAAVTDPAAAAENSKLKWDTQRQKLLNSKLRRDNRRLREKYSQFLQELKEHWPETYSSYVAWKRNQSSGGRGRGRSRGKSIGGDSTPLPVGNAGSQPDAVNTADLLMAGPITYSRIPSLGTTDDLQGVFLANYGDHGSEMLLMQRSTDPSGQEWVTATKLTGDSNVPAGEVSFRAAIGRSKQLPPAAHMEMLGVTRRFKGEGHIANSGFTNPRWIPGDLLQFAAANPITRGSTTGIVWNLPERQPFLVVLHRVKLEEDLQDIPNRPDRGT